MTDEFSKYHPAVTTLYFSVVIGFIMFVSRPECLAASLMCAFGYTVYMDRRKATRIGLLYMIPTLIVTALINPLFNHEGATVILYFRGGNPLTLESVFFGIAAAVTLVAVIMWFSRFNAVMTSDKIVYLFGRAIPSLSLILSMSLRFAPRFAEQFRAVSHAQRCAGRGMTEGNLPRRAENGARVLSATVTWALENAVETADSMKSRGYGLPGRTAFSIYRFEKKDCVMLVFIGVITAYIVAGAALGGLYFRYFPTVGGVHGVFTTSVYAAYFALCALPIAVNVWEDRKWTAIISKI